MDERIEGDDDQVDTRAGGLLPEEQQAGSDDPEAQAEQILQESEERTFDRDTAPSSHLETRTSEDTVDPT